MLRFVFVINAATGADAPNRDAASNLYVSIKKTRPNKPTMRPRDSIALIFVEFSMLYVDFSELPMDGRTER